MEQHRNLGTKFLPSMHKALWSILSTRYTGVMRMRSPRTQDVEDELKAIHNYILQVPGQAKPHILRKLHLRKKKKKDSLVWLRLAPNSDNFGFRNARVTGVHHHSKTVLKHVSELFVSNIYKRPSLKSYNILFCFKYQDC